MLSAIASGGGQCGVALGKMCLAKGKYDNLAETPDELAFRKGDILTVIEKSIHGLEGWWLCSFRGRQGIVPANRLTLLAGMYNESTLRFSTSPDSSISDGGGPEYDTPKSYKDHSVKPTNHPYNRLPMHDVVYDIPKSLEQMHLQQHGPIRNTVYDVPQPQGKFRISQLEAQSNRSSAMSPDYKSADSAVDMRSNRSSLISNTSSPPGSSVYDSSRSSMELLDVYDVPNSRPVKPTSPSRQQNISSHLDCVYDVPKSVKEKSEREKAKSFRDSGIYDNAKPSKNVLHNKGALEDIYDKPVSRKSLGQINSLKGHIPEGVYDVPPQVLRDTGHIVPPEATQTNSKSGLLQLNLSQYEELPLELEAAVETLVKLQQDVNTSVARLLNFVCRDWRKRRNLEPKMYDLKICCIGLQTHVQEFIDFGTGALANTNKLSDRSIAFRLHQQLSPLQDKMQAINKNMKHLSSIKWHINKLEDNGNGSVENDELAMIVRFAQELNSDVSRVASVIHGNSTLIFKRSNTDHVSSTETLSRESQLLNYNEYDYCELKEPIPVSNTPIDAVDSPRQNQITDIELTREVLSDQQYMKYYLQQVKSIASQVKDHVDKLHTSVQQRDTVQILVGKSRMLVSTAHKLVYIGDTLSRALTQPILRTGITNSANDLCTALKETIMSTKEAALAASHNRDQLYEKLIESAIKVNSAVVGFQGVMLSPD